MTTTPPSQPAPKVTRTAGNAQQTAWQYRVTGTLRGILERAEMGNLPPIAWTVQRAGAELMGTCYAQSPAERRAEFGAWRDALTRWTGHSADISREHTGSAGIVRLTEHWEDYGGVSVTLVADIYPEDDGS
jgi:hypothetical protein